MKRFVCKLLLVLVVMLSGFAKSDIVVAETMDTGKDGVPGNTLRIAFGNNSPPLYWLDKSQGDRTKVQGMMVELMGEVAERAGFSFQKIAFPHKRIQSMVEAGEMDGMVNVVTPTRLEYSLSSTEPIQIGRVGVFMRRDSLAFDRVATVKTLDDLAKANITVVGILGSGWTKQHIESRGIPVVHGLNTVKTVKMLILGRADVLVDMSDNINWILKSELGGRLIVEMPAPIQAIGWHLLISKRSPFSKKMTKLNKAIKELKASPTYKQLLGKYGIVE